MAFPLLRSMAVALRARKNRRRSGFAAGEEPRACGGRARVARGWSKTWWGED